MIETDKGHVWFTFDNGYTISIFNGYGSYSENHFNKKVLQTPEFAAIESKNCEVAIIYEGEIVTNNLLKCNDSVKGYVDINELVELINYVRNL